MLFNKERRRRNRLSQRAYALFEIAYTAVDFAAALAFLAGSVMFLSEAWKTAGTWFYIAGSICFVAKAAIRLARELKLAAIGDTEDLAKRLQG